MAELKRFGLLALLFVTILLVGVATMNAVYNGVRSRAPQYQSARSWYIHASDNTTLDLERAPWQFWGE